MTTTEIATQIGPAWGVPEVEVGSRVAGRFVISGVLGSGGTGRVYRAIDHTSGSEVALKIFAGGGDAERFAREGALLAGLRHPAIVAYVEHGVAAGGHRYLATELLEGPTLKEHLRAGPLSQAQTAQVAIRVLHALAAAHRAGIVHRDIKPENLLVVGGNLAAIKVLDFGIARRIDGFGVTGTGHWVGTPLYMAPEQARGQRDVDGRADLFALSCLLIECLTGQPPFIADTLLATLAKICMEDEVPITEHCPSLHPDLAQLLASLLKKDRDERPRDASKVAAHLEQLLPSLTHETAAPTSVPSTRAIGTSERRVRALILVSAPPESASTETPPTETDSDLTTRLSRMALGVHSMLNGAMAMTVRGDSPMDQAVQAARCALAARDAFPDRAIAIAIGRREESTLVRRHVADVTTGLLGDAAPGEIRLDEATAELLMTRFDVASRKINLGTVFELRGERGSLEPPRTVLGKALPCLGRQRELANLAALFGECVDEGAPRVVVVTAPAGAGKSRLRFEIMRRLQADHPQATVLIARGDPLRTGVPLGLVAEMLRGQAQLTGQEDLATQRQLVSHHLGRHLTEAADFDAAHRARAVAFLGELCDVPFPDDDLPALNTARRDAHVMGDQTRLAWLDWFGAEVNAAPLIVVLEDLHWGDGPSVHLIDETLRYFGPRPIFVMAFARPEIDQRFPDLWAARKAERTPLRPLPLKAAEQLVAQALPDLPAAQVHSLAERADGNPFFLEELMRSLSVSDPASTTTAPATVLGVVQARFDELGDIAKRVLRAASVFGEHFDRAGVAALIGHGHVADVERWLDILIDKEMVYRRVGDAGTGRYSFRHALLRDAAYDMLTDADRITAHAAAADYLEATGTAEAMVLVEHLERAQQRERAAEWCAVAAEQAVQAGDIAATIALAERGKNNGAQGDCRMRLLVAEGDARCWRGEYAAAEVLLKEVVDNGNEALRLHAALPMIYAVGNQDKGTHLQQVLDKLRMPRDRRLAASWQTAVLVGARYADPDEQTKCLAKVRSKACLPNIHTAGHYLLVKGRIFDGIGRRVEALRALEEAVACFDHCGNLREALSARANYASAFIDLGQLELAFDAGKAVEVLATRLGIETVAAFSFFHQAAAFYHRRNYQEAIRASAVSVGLLRRHGEKSTRRAALAIAALANLRADDPSTALHLALEALTEGAAGAAACLVHAAIGAAWLSLGNLTNALGEAEEALAQTASAHHVTGSLSLAHTIRTRCLLALGRLHDAAAAVHTGLSTLATEAIAIDHPEYRRTFLRNIIEHVELIELAQSMGVEFGAPSLQVLITS